MHRQDISLIGLLTSESHIRGSTRSIVDYRDSETWIQGLFYRINSSVNIFWSPVSKTSKQMLAQSLFTQTGIKGKKGTVVFDLISYQFTSLFACGCDCNIKLTQFPGHYCSEAKQLFSCCYHGLYVWENFRDYSDISKKLIIWVRVPWTLWVLGLEGTIHLFLRSWKVTQAALTTTVIPL